MLDSLRKIGQETMKMLEALRKQEPDSTTSYDCGDLRSVIAQLSTLYRSAENGNSLETLSDLVENELATMDKAIEEAAMRIEVLIFQPVFIPKFHHYYFLFSLLLLKIVTI